MLLCSIFLSLCTLYMKDIFYRIDLSVYLHIAYSV